MKTPIDLSTLTSAQKDALIVDLLELVNTLTQQVQELQAQLKLNSRNSSKPPSSDGYGKPKPKKYPCQERQAFRWSARSPRADAKEDRSPGSYRGSCA